MFSGCAQVTIFFDAAANATMACAKGAGRARACADGSRSLHDPYQRMEPKKQWIKHGRRTGK